MTHDIASHVHDPDPPRGGRRHPVWTPEEIDLLEKLRGEGRTYKEIGALMNRTAAGVKQRWRWINITPEERLARADRQYRARNGIVDPNTRARRRRMEEANAKPAEVFIDRHHRINAPRTLTAIFCGDPAPGWSALDRKQQEARA